MADDGQRSEKASKRKLEKARKEGQFAVSREFVSAIQFVGFVWMLVNWSGLLLHRGRDFMRFVFTHAFEVQVDRISVVQMFRQALVSMLAPLLVAGAGLTAITFCAQLGTTRLGVSLHKLAPDFKRFDPIKKLKDTVESGLSALLQTLLLIPLVVTPKFMLQ